MTAKEKKFIPLKITKDDLKENNGVDLANLYERAHVELTLQQTKRDQIITLFFSIFSLLVPLALSLEKIPFYVKGLTFLVVGVIGIIFSVIVIRYRIYKEVYWLCCETITCMMNVEDAKLNKQMIQTLFYRCLKKKGDNFCKDIGQDKKQWSFGLYFKKNIFSSETLHYLIIVLLTSILIALGLFLALYEIPFLFWAKILICVAISVALLILLFLAYFIKCQEVYSVLKYDTDPAFNKAFEKAWFLHTYVEIKDLNGTEI